MQINLSFLEIFYHGVYVKETLSPHTGLHHLCDDHSLLCRKYISSIIWNTNDPKDSFVFCASYGDSVLAASRYWFCMIPLSAGNLVWYWIRTVFYDSHCSHGLDTERIDRLGCDPCEYGSTPYYQIYIPSRISLYYVREFSDRRIFFPMNRTETDGISLETWILYTECEYVFVVSCYYFWNVVFGMDSLFGIVWTLFGWFIFLLAL